jgi:hypothetical protein
MSRSKRRFQASDETRVRRRRARRTSGVRTRRRAETRYSSVRARATAKSGRTPTRRVRRRRGAASRVGRERTRRREPRPAGLARSRQPRGFPLRVTFPGRTELRRNSSGRPRPARGRRDRPRHRCRGRPFSGGGNLPSSTTVGRSTLVVISERSDVRAGPTNDGPMVLSSADGGGPALRVSFSATFSADSSRRNTVCPSHTGGCRRRVSYYWRA